MMQLKAINSRSILSWISVLVVFAFAKAINAQTLSTKKEDEAIKNEVLAALKDTVEPTKVRYKIDGVSGVIGDYVVLDSDVQQEIMAMRRENQMGEVQNFMHTMRYRIVSPYQMRKLRAQQPSV